MTHLKSFRTAAILAVCLWMASIAVARAQSAIQQIIINTTRLIEYAAVLVWTLCLVVFGWGIVKFIASAGNEEELKKAKGILWWGVIGLFALASVVGIIEFFQRYFGIRGVQIIDPPQFHNWL